MSIKSLQERRTPGSRDECRTAQDGRRPLDQANELEPLARLYAAMKLHPPSPSLLLSPEADTHFTIQLISRSDQTGARTWIFSSIWAVTSPAFGLPVDF